MKVYPSMLSADPSCYKKDLLKLSAAKGIHWDIMDGNFVEDITFGAGLIKSVRNCTTQEFNVHLMVNSPENHIEKFAKAGADTIIVHVESTNKLRYCLRLINSFNIKSGVAINPETSPDFIKYIKDQIDEVLIMTVEPGRAGQSFIYSQLDKIKEVTQMVDSNIEVCVDGAVDYDIARICEQLGVDSCVSGSYIFKSEDYTKAIQLLAGYTCP